jgi:hypothetical protein
MIRKIVLCLFVSLWLAAVFFGVGWLWSYNHAAGAQSTPPEQWPEKVLINRNAEGDTLVMLAHPKCPCTRASIEELSKLMTSCKGRLTAHVLLVAPSASALDWPKTDLWTSAASIPGVTVSIDRDGREASQFGALTSGQVVLYDANGRLLFSGGITQSRGHSGDNAGRSAIESLVNRGTAEADRSLVFGCPLFDPDSDCRKPEHGKSTY